MSWVLHMERWLSRRLQKRGFESRDIQTSVGKVHVHDKMGTGTLPPLVLLHGIAANGTTWAPMLSTFARYFKRVLVVDAPGHGFSELPSKPVTAPLLFQGIAEVLNQELEEPAVVCGNSLGGGGTLKFAVEHPEKVCGIVLLSPAGAWMTEEQLTDLRTIFNMQKRNDAKEFLKKLYHRPPMLVPLILAGEILRRFRLPQVQSILSNVTEEDFFSPEELASLTMPGVLVWGQSERILPKYQLAYFKKHLPSNIRIEEPTGFGHSPHLDDPKAVAQIVIALGQQVATPQLTA